jgi:hypothetical protein
MAVNCTTLVGIPKDCADNNQGSIKRSLITDFANVTGFTATSTGAADTDGNITAITMASTTKFEEFIFKKDTSSFTQNRVGDLTADAHGFEQQMSLGFRRIDLRKRNAIMLLAEGRRDLAVIVEDWNGDYWALGFDQGMRMNEMESGTNTERTAGQFWTVNFIAEMENVLAYKVDPAIITALLTAA